MDIAAIVGTVVTSLVLGVAANLLTPKVSAWIDQRYVKSRSQTIKQINDEVAYITKLHKSPERLISLMFGYVLFLLLLLTLLIICGFVLVIVMAHENTLSFSAGVLLGAGIVLFIVMVRVGMSGFDILSEFAHFEEYVDSAQKRIAELESKNH